MNRDPSLALLPAPDAGANAPALIVGNFDVAYDYVRQYSSRCALVARALFGRNLMFLSKSVTDLMSVYDDVCTRKMCRSG